MGSLQTSSHKIHCNQSYQTTGEEKHSSLCAGAAANDNNKDNTRIGPLPLEEECAATMMDDRPLLGTGHSSCSRMQISTSDGRFRGGGVGADDDGRRVAMGNRHTVGDEGNLIPRVDLRHCKQ